MINCNGKKNIAGTFFEITDVVFFLVEGRGGWREE